MYIDHNVLYSGDYISALRGCCPLKFLHALQIDPGLLVHTPRGTGVPKKFQSWKFKIWPKIQRVTLNNFRATGSILTKLFSVDVPQGGIDKLGTIFGGPAPENLRGQKSSKIFRDFWQLSTLIANISRTDSHIEIGKVVYQLQPLPRWLKESPWTLVQKRKSYWG